jgi:hypothetical protein
LFGGGGAGLGSFAFSLYGHCLFVCLRLAFTVSPYLGEIYFNFLFNSCEV